MSFSLCYIGNEVASLLFMGVPHSRNAAILKEARVSISVCYFLTHTSHLAEGEISPSAVHGFTDENELEAATPESDSSQSIGEVRAHDRRSVFSGPVLLVGFCVLFTDLPGYLRHKWP